MVPQYLFNCSLHVLSSRGKLRGFVATDEETIEISPLTYEQQTLYLRSPESLGQIPYRSPQEEESIVVEDLYVVKKAKLPSFSAVEEQLGEGTLGHTSV